MKQKKLKIGLDDVFSPSKDVVARKIEGEMIIIPLTAGIGDLEDDLYTLNETGQAVWEKLDGKKDVGTIVKELSKEYGAPSDVIKKDVMGILSELARRRIVHSKTVK
jgi:hypothetical protein